MSERPSTPFQRASKPGSRSSNTAIDVHPKTVSSAVLEAETNWILANVTIVDAAKLLTASFGKAATDATKATSRTLSNCFRQAKGTMEWKVEAEMYKPLCIAFNKCCEGIKPNVDPDDYVPKNPLLCLNLHQKRYPLPREMSFGTKIGPDFCFSFDYSKNKNWAPCDHPNVFIEAKLSPLTDLASGKREEPSQARKDLMRQLFGYVAYGQWPSLPYRFCWSISVSGHLMRIWRWTASGVVVSEPIEYLKDATIVAQFIQLVASGPYSRLGLDVGRGMTFSMADPAETRTTRLAMTAYANALPGSKSQTRWVERAEKCNVWRFKPTCSDRPSEPPSPGHQVNDERDASDYTLVVSHPISWTLGVFTRGTRCYLVIYKSDAKKEEDISIGEIHTLKLSWQYTTRTSELVFFNEVKLRSPNHHIPHLASVIWGGDIPYSIQTMGLFQKNTQCMAEQPTSCVINDEDLVKDYEPVILDPSGVIASDPRVLRGIIFKEVGAPLGHVSNPKQMIQAICDAVEAHKSLHLIGILHRDISEGNVLLDLNNDYRGLLIDLDMAMDLLRAAISNEQNKAFLPDITGTLRFLSVGLASRPIHRSWHDLESFFWLLVYMTIKHVPEVTLAHDLGAATPDSERAVVLRAVFPDNGADSEAFGTMIAAKVRFLNQGKLKILPNNGALTVLIREFQRTFGTLHQTLEEVVSFQEDWAEALQQVTLPDFDSFKTNPRSFGTMDDLLRFRTECDTALEALDTAVSSEDGGGISEAIDPSYLESEGRRVIGSIDRLRQFPTYNYILDNLNKALEKPSPKWAVQSVVIEPY